MKLKEYNSPCKNIIDVPTIRFSGKGTITINAVASELLNLKPGVKISFAQDTEHPKDWFLRTNVLTGITLKRRLQRKNLEGHYRELSCEIIKSTESDKHARFQLSTEMHDGMYAIITANKL